MKKQSNRSLEAHVVRGAFYVLLLPVVCVIPLALAQRNTDERSTAVMQLPAISSDTGRAVGALPLPQFPMGVLWDQYDNPATDPPINIGSQDFEPAFDPLDDQAADDFVLTFPFNNGITGVRVMGEYSEGGGPASSFNVYFYTNGAGNLPGPLIAAFLNLPYNRNPSRLYYHVAQPVRPRSGNLLGLGAGPARFQSKRSVVLAQPDCSIERGRYVAEPGQRLRHRLHHLEP